MCGKMKKKRRDGMNTLEAIAKRRSTRAYRNEQITEEELSVILKAADASPIAMAKYETLHITVVQDEKLIKRINDLTSEMFSRMAGEKRDVDYGAKTLIFVSANGEGLPPEMTYANVGIVVENMVLAATDLGVDSVILGGSPRVMVNDAELMRELGVPEGFRPVLGAAFGYAADEGAPREHGFAKNRV